MSSSTTQLEDTDSWDMLQAVNSDRFSDVDQKHRLVADFLERHQFDALLLQRSGNFSWFTSGGDCSRAGSSERTASLFITPEARLIVCSNADSEHLFDREVPGLGFQLKERPWYEPRQVLVEDLCRGRTVASDTGVAGTRDVSVFLREMRVALTALECERIRETGRMVTHAIEATARNLAANKTEAEIAAELAHRLIKQQVIPERLQVLGDGRLERCRHGSYGGDLVEQSCTIAAVGRRLGLCVAAARTVSLGSPPADLRAAHHRAMLVQSTGMYFSQVDWELFEVWNRVQRIYEKYGCDNEWQQAAQANIIGYESCEIPVVPKSEFRLAARMAVHWHPSVGSALVGDTILVTDSGYEQLTLMENWPRLKVVVKQMDIYRPDILRIR